MEDKKDSIHRKIGMLIELDTDIQENKRIDVAKGYRQTRLKIQKQSRTQWIFRTLNRAAAILVIPLLTSTCVLMYMQQNSGKKPDTVLMAYTEISAVPGAIIKATLPDESEVWLNSGTTLRYPNQFASDKREVELAGEAFFEVKASMDHPFEVLTPSGMKVIALGTAFNVNAYEDEAVFETVLRNGRVEVVRGVQKVTLSPGEIAVDDRLSDRLHKSSVNVDEKTGWKEGLLIFRNTSLDDVFKRLARHYSVEIVLHKETQVDYRIRATFSTETLEQILDVLKIATPITWSTEKMPQNKDLTYPQKRIDVWIK